MMEKMYTTEEAAKELNIGVNTVRIYIRDGKIKAMKYTDSPKGEWRIPESELKKFRGEK